VRAKARQTFAQQILTASANKITIRKPIVITAKKPAAAQAGAAPAGPGPLGRLVADDRFWVGLLVVGVMGSAIAWHQMRKPASEKSVPLANPATKKAVKFYREFHWGRKPKRITRAEVATAPATLVKLGELQNVTYTAKKGKDPIADYTHDFEVPRPVLAADPETRRLHVVGGDYKIEERGIVG
jgi:hypothetical protein